MSSIITPFLAFLLLYKYLAIFVVVCSAAIILPIPSNSVLLAAGAFASQGYFSFSLSLAAAIGANVLGDSFDFFLARRYGHRAISMLGIKTLPTYFKHLEHYVHNNPGLAIFFTRFVGTVEPLTSLLCGFSGVSYPTFLTYDILGNLASDGGILYTGYFFGANWQEVSGIFSLAGWIAFGTIVLIALAIAAWYRNHDRVNVETPTG